MTPTKEQLEYNEYLLEIMRNCGMFKCTDCLYALWEDRSYGMEYKCCHPRTLPHSAWRDLDTAMFGSACDAFEPSEEAKGHLVERMVKTSKAVEHLADFAWRHSESELDNEWLRKTCRDIDEQGMVRI